MNAERWLKRPVRRKKEGLKLKRNLPENFQLSVKGMSVQADGNSWKGRAKRITSLLFRNKHVRSPDSPGDHRLHRREMLRKKMTL